MTNLTTYPLIDAFETTLSQSWNGATGTVYVQDTPAFTFPSGVTTYIVVNPGKTNMQVAKIDSYDSNANTLNVSSISVNKWASVAYTQQSHAAGSKVIISDNYQFWKDIADAINSKLDANWGNAWATFDLDLTGSNFRIRKDGSNMKFRDDTTPETTLTQLASGGWADQKVAITVSDTTTGVLDSKLTAGNGLSKTVVNPGWSETLDLDIDTSDTTVFVATSAGAADEDKVPILNANWQLDRSFLDTSDQIEIDAWENVTAWDLVSIEWSSIYKTTRTATAVAQISTITGIDSDKLSVQIEYLENNKAVVCYKKSSDNIAYARVITFDRESINTVGSEVAVSWAMRSNDTSKLVVLSSSLFVNCYILDSDDHIYWVACTVSWTTITAGSLTDLTPAQTFENINNSVSACKVSSSSFIAGWLWAASGDPHVVACTISGTTITAWTTDTVATTSMTGQVILVPISTWVVACLYDNGTNVFVEPLTISGTTITQQTSSDTWFAGVLNTGDQAFYIEWGRILIVRNGNTSWAFCVIQTINIANQSTWAQWYWLSFNSYSIPSDGNSAVQACMYYLWNNQLAYINLNAWNSDIRLRIMQLWYDWINPIIDTTIAATASQMWIAPLSTTTEKLCIVYRDSWTNNLNYSIWLNTEKEFIWVVKTTTTAGNDAPIFFAGNATISWLTAGLVYYVWDNWAVSTTWTRKIWVATSSTNLLLT